MKSVFILGDSICIYYLPYLLPILESDFMCQTKKGRAEAMQNLDVPIKANAGNTTDILAFLKLEEENGNLNYNYLLFNSGLHDVVYPFDKEANKLKDSPRTKIDKYEENLNKILDKMQEYNIKPIFITTTPVDDERHNTRVAFHRHQKDVLHYNDVAKSVMKLRGIPVIDLFEFTVSQNGELFRDHVHFLDDIAEKQANFLAEEFKKIVKNY